MTQMVKMNHTVKMTKSANKPVPCPICKENDSAQPYKPFCSPRCANVDLHRWLGGRYSVPAVDPPDHFFEDEDTSGEIH